VLQQNLVGVFAVTCNPFVSLGNKVGGTTLPERGEERLGRVGRTGGSKGVTGAFFKSSLPKVNVSVVAILPPILPVSIDEFTADVIPEGARPDRPATRAPS